jgi:hypothetical protein
VITGTSSLAPLFEKALVSQSLEDGSSGRPVHLEDVTRFGIGERLSPRRMHQGKTIGSLQASSSFQLANPRALRGGDSTSDWQRHHHLVAEILELRRIEHLFEHRVLHYVDASARVLRKTEESEGADDGQVPRRGGFPDVVHRYRLWEAPGRADLDRRRPHLDSHRSSIQLIGAVCQGISHCLSNDDRWKSGKIESAHPQDDELGAQFLVDTRNGPLKLMRERSFDLEPEVVVDRPIVAIPQDLDVAFSQGFGGISHQIESSCSGQSAPGGKSVLRQPLGDVFRAPAECGSQPVEEIRVRLFRRGHGSELVARCRSLIDELLELGPEKGFVSRPLSDSYDSTGHLGKSLLAAGH